MNPEQYNNQADRAPEEDKDGKPGDDNKGGGTKKKESDDEEEHSMSGAQAYQKAEKGAKSQKETGTTYKTRSKK